VRRAATLLIVLLACPCVFATTLMGPSTTLLDGDRFGLSVEYSRTEADVTFDLDPGRATEDFDFDTTYALFSAAATQWWEFFLRLGAAQAEATGFDGDMNFSWGLGTRLTVLDWNDFTWGAMLQFTNIISRFDTMHEFLVGGTPTLLETEEELDFVEYDFATGPTWQHGPLTVYGGLLLRYVTGQLDFDAGRVGDSFNIDRQWDAGGYVGGTLTLFKGRPSWLSRCDLIGEGRFTGDSSGFSAALLLPFGGEP
jgi:hypothetical protein